MIHQVFWCGKWYFVLRILKIFSFIYDAHNWKFRTTWNKCHTAIHQTILEWGFWIRISLQDFLTLHWNNTWIRKWQEINHLICFSKRKHFFFGKSSSCSKFSRKKLFLVQIQIFLGVETGNLRIPSKPKADMKFWIRNHQYVSYRGSNYWTGSMNNLNYGTKNRSSNQNRRKTNQTFRPKWGEGIDKTGLCESQHDVQIPRFVWKFRIAKDILSAERELSFWHKPIKWKDLQTLTFHSNFWVFNGFNPTHFLEEKHLALDFYIMFSFKSKMETE